MPEPTPDLAAIVAAIDAAPISRNTRTGWRKPIEPSRAELLVKHWPALRANLMFGPPSTEEELAAAQCRVDLEAALLREDYAKRCMAELEVAATAVASNETAEDDWECVRASDLAALRALLARSAAAKEESERG